MKSRFGNSTLIITYNEKGKHVERQGRKVNGSNAYAMMAGLP